MLYISAWLLPLTLPQLALFELYICYTPDNLRSPSVSPPFLFVTVFFSDGVINHRLCSVAATATTTTTHHEARGSSINPRQLFIALTPCIDWSGPICAIWLLPVVTPVIKSPTRPSVVTAFQNNGYWFTAIDLRHGLWLVLSINHKSLHWKKKVDKSSLAK